MNFSLNNQEQDEVGIELTSLIDVVFLLLIFFMISTTFTKESSLRINLPSADQNLQTSDLPTRIDVYVGADAEYALASDKDAKARPLINSNRDTLMRALSEYEKSDKLVLIVRADKQAPHEAVIKVLDVAQQLGLSNISFATKQNTE